MKRKKTDPKYVGAVNGEHRRIKATINNVVAKPTRAVFVEKQAQVIAATRRASRGMAQREVTVASKHLMARNSLTMMIDLGAAITNEAKASVEQVARESLYSLNRFMNAAKIPGQLPDDAIDTLVGQRLGALQQHVASNAVRASAEIAQAVKKKLLLSNVDHFDELLGVMDDSLDHEWWRILRIINTDSAFTYNLIRDDALKELSRSVSGLMRRWTEHVDDATGRPMDNRVGGDSLVLHGQLSPPGGVFIMPGWGTDKTSSRMVGRTWNHPPNRPHDRAVLTPWTPGRGVPGWILDDGDKLDLR